MCIGGRPKIQTVEPAKQFSAPKAAQQLSPARALSASRGGTSSKAASASAPGTARRRAPTAALGAMLQPMMQPSAILGG